MKRLAGDNPMRCPCTLGEMLRKTVCKFPWHLAVTFLNRRYTYEHVWQLTGRLARSFLSLGIKKGTHAAILAESGPEMLFCLYALWRIGAVAIPLCTAYSESELDACISMTDAAFLLTDRRDLCRHGPPVPRGSQGAPSGICPVFIPDLLSAADAYGGPPLPEAGISGEALRAAEASVCPSDCDMILMTSGSTGGPKPVLTTHASRVSTAIAQAKAIAADENDRFCSPLPMYHCFSLTATVLAALSAGACICFPVDHHTPNVLQVIEEHQCTVLNAVPSLYSALVRRIQIQNRPIRSLRVGVIGGSTCRAELFRRSCETLDFRLLPSLGQTEATGGITIGSLEDPMEISAATLGQFFPHLEGCILTEEKIPAPRGTPGEICVRGIGVMREYYHLPELTRAAIDSNGWLHTGDIGWQDEELRVHYCGRIKELIIRGGENVSPYEIEQVILQDPRVRQAKVVDVPDDYYIEEICACIICEHGVSVTDKELQSAVAQRLAPFKVPRYILRFEEFPRKSSGKPDIQALRELAAARIRQPSPRPKKPLSQE